MEQTGRLIQTPDWFRAPEQRFPDLHSVVRREFISIAEAEEYADRLGVMAWYRDFLVIANFANEMLTQLNERNQGLPLSILVGEPFFARLHQQDSEAVAMSANGVLFINPASRFWDDPIGATILLHEEGFGSTPHPLHALYHEAGHLVQTPQAVRQKPLTPREMGIANAVSDRAKQDADEFVAEVYAGLLVGIRYDADILRIYRRFGGRKP